MEMKYTKIPFSEEEKIMLQESAKERGLRLSQYIRECLFNEKSSEVSFDQSVLEAHTKAVNHLREELKEIYWAPMEEKILLSGFFQKMHESMFRIEMDEARIGRDVRKIKSLLQGGGEDILEEGEQIADI